MAHSSPASYCRSFFFSSFFAVVLPSAATQRDNCSWQQLCVTELYIIYEIIGLIVNERYWQAKRPACIFRAGNLSWVSLVPPAPVRAFWSRAEDWFSSSPFGTKPVDWGTAVGLCKTDKSPLGLKLTWIWLMWLYFISSDSNNTQLPPTHIWGGVVGKHHGSDVSFTTYCLNGVKLEHRNSSIHKNTHFLKSIKGKSK